MMLLIVNLEEYLVNSTIDPFYFILWPGFVSPIIWLGRTEACCYIQWDDLRQGKL